MKAFFIILVALLATEAGAVQVLSLNRVVSYRGGLEEPGAIEDSRSSNAFGGFSEDLSDTLISAAAQTEAATSQLSAVETAGGGLAIIVNAADVSARAVTLAEGTISDAFAETKLELVFSTQETMKLTVDVVVSSNLGPFFDGPGVGEVEASHVGSFLLCVVGGGCLADLFVEDISDNLQAVADGIDDSIQIPPGSYLVELLAISQAVSRDEGSTLGSAGFSGAITVEPVPEPGSGLLGSTALLVLAGLHRYGSSRRAALDRQRQDRDIARADGLVFRG